MWQRYNQTTHIFEKSTDNGVSWLPLPLSGAIITEGSISDAHLSANVALENVANVFGQDQIVYHGAMPRWRLGDGTGPEGCVQLVTNAQVCLIYNAYYSPTGWHLNYAPYPGWFLNLTVGSDSAELFRIAANTTTPVRLWYVDNGGRICERQRTVALGSRTAWSPVGYSAEGAAIGGSVQAGYTIVGSTVFWNMYIVNFNLPAATSALRFTIPPGYPPVAPDTEISSIRVFAPGVGDRWAWTQVNVSFISAYLGPNWNAGVGHVIGQGFYTIAA